jgi:hypothetical protein
MVSDQLVLFAVAASAITLLLGVLVIVVRTRKIGEQLSELDALKRSVQEVQRDFARIVRVSDRTFVGLQALSGVGLHFRRIKSEQSRLAEKLKMISSAMETLTGLLQHRDEIKEVVEASRSLQEWKSRMTAVYSDAGYLFESEPIRELIDRFGPQPTNAAEPPDRSERRSRPSQKKVRARRQG